MGRFCEGFRTTAHVDSHERKRSISHPHRRAPSSLVIDRHPGCLAAHRPGIAFLAALITTAVVMSAELNPVSRTNSRIQPARKPNGLAPTFFAPIKSP